MGPNEKVDAQVEVLTVMVGIEGGNLEWISAPGEVTIQVIFDPPRHERLPINDDEIADRCVVCQPYTRNLTLPTYDTGQSMRARAAGVKVEKLSKELGAESEASAGT